MAGLRSTPTRPSQVAGLCRFVAAVHGLADLSVLDDEVAIACVNDVRHHGVALIGTGQIPVVSVHSRTREQQLGFLSANVVEAQHSLPAVV